MYELSRRQVFTAAAGVATLAVAGCGSSSKSSDNLSANRTGAMDKFGVGDQFKATVPASFSVMLLSNAN